MIVKAVEIRDKATFIPALAIGLKPMWEAERYLLRRCGYTFDPPSILLIHLASGRCEYDPHAWSNRTMVTAHAWIIENFHNIAQEVDAVVDVEFILGETRQVKRSERFDHPL